MSTNWRPGFLLSFHAKNNKKKSLLSVILLSNGYRYTATNSQTK